MIGLFNGLKPLNKPVRLKSWSKELSTSHLHIARLYFGSILLDYNKSLLGKGLQPTENGFATHYWVPTHQLGTTSLNGIIWSMTKMSQSLCSRPTETNNSILIFDFWHKPAFIILSGSNFCPDFKSWPFCQRAFGQEMSAHNTECAQSFPVIVIHSGRTP